MFALFASISFASPSAAPHIARRSSLSTAAWRSAPALPISASAAPSAIVAGTVSDGPRRGGGAALEPGAPDPAGGGAFEALGPAVDDGARVAPHAAAMAAIAT